MHLILGILTMCGVMTISDWQAIKGFSNLAISCELHLVWSLLLVTSSCHILESQHIRLSNQITILWNLCVQAPAAWCMRGVGFIAF
jgi:hypothetical protein